MRQTNFDKEAVAAAARKNRERREAVRRQRDYEQYRAMLKDDTAGGISPVAVLAALLLGAVCAGVVGTGIWWMLQ